MGQKTIRKLSIYANQHIHIVARLLRTCRPRL